MKFEKNIFLVSFYYWISLIDQKQICLSDFGQQVDSS